MQLHPQEIEVWYVLPAIRRAVCKGLVKKGLSQRETAKLLGITEPAVSQYIRSKRASKLRFSQEMSGLIDDVCLRITSGKISAYAGIQELAAAYRHSGCMCTLHRKLDKVPPCCEKGLSSICRD